MERNEHYVLDDIHINILFTSLYTCHINHNVELNNFLVISSYGVHCIKG